MSKGQKVMIVAMACSETEQTIRTAAEQNDISATRLPNAIVVLKHTPGLANANFSINRIAELTPTALAARI